MDEPESGMSHAGTGLSRVSHSPCYYVLEEQKGEVSDIQTRRSGAHHCSSRLAGPVIPVLQPNLHTGHLRPFWCSCG